MYREKRFRVRQFEEVERDIADARREFPQVGRVFLCDGDALAIEHAPLIRILDAIRVGLPNVIRVSTYANAKSIALKTDVQLTELRELNLKLFHTGLESGDDETLHRMQKHGNAQFHVVQAQRAQAAGIKLFVTVLLGLGGQSRSQEHAIATAQTLTQMNPSSVGALSLMVIPGTPLHFDLQRGEFALPTPKEMLLELRTMLERTEIRGIFYANHASNYFPIRARLPRDRAEAVAQIDAALAGRVPLKPEWMRAY
jgi:radical SAM superfamily enzyme YgiQ (UPF0313 family)